MPKYKCVNKSCEDFEKIKTEYSITVKWVDGKQVTAEQICPKCGLEREFVRDFEGFCTALHGSGNLCNK